ncbi:MAG: energy transducer TonB [Methylophilaceae bacterium]
MELSRKHSSINESTLIWAIVASILLHILMAIVLPNFKFDAVKKIPDILSVEIQKRTPPAPVVIPEPPKPAPEPIKKLVEPKPVTKPITKKVDAPSPVKQVEMPPPAAVEQSPKVIAVDPKPDATPHEVAPEPPIEKHKPEPLQADVDNALGEYGSLLGRSIAKHKSYPKIAQMRGWEGQVMLDLKIDGNGNVLSAKVRDTSGHEALDNQALEMVRKASPFPAPPDALRSRTFSISVPVSFKLEAA